ncbi:MAG: metallophosphoesterase [Clostridia bacterium]|nr:metallophosphoesterase [Clostridia bacterium]
MKTFFIADTHFGDANIFRYENRPFASVAEMDAALIARWNAAVRPEDRVYHLGDFSVPGQEAALLSQLNGTKYLIKGNHDVRSNQAYRDLGFAEVYDLPVILDGFWILSHEALYVNINMPYANLFGHVHASPVVRDCSPQHFCACVERIGYTPIDFDEIKRKIKAAVDAV